MGDVMVIDDEPVWPMYTCADCKRRFRGSWFVTMRKEVCIRCFAKQPRCMHDIIRELCQRCDMAARRGTTIRQED